MSFRDGPFSDIKVPLTWAAAGAVALVLIAAVALLLSDRRETLEEQAYGKIRSTADSVSAPISGAISAPVGWVRNGVDGVRGYFFAVSDNRRLRKENKYLQDVRAQLAAQKDLNERYVALLGLKTDPPMPMVSGRAITDSRGPFANSRLVNIGGEAGVKVGNPVMSENGLVGRIVGVSDKVSRILLLTDIASRTPVMIDRNNARAILTGDGGPHPKLDYLRAREAPKVGDILVTSGDGGVMPRGLPVGVVVKGIDGSWRAQLASDRAPIDFVRILKFEDFAQLADERKLSAVVLPRNMGGALPLPTVTAPTPPAAAAPLAAPKAAVAPPAAPLKAVPPTVAPAAPKTPVPTPKAVVPAPKAAGPAVPAAPLKAAPVPAAPLKAPAATVPLKTAPPPAVAPALKTAPATLPATAPAAKAPAPKPAQPKLKGPVTTSDKGRTFRKVETPDRPPVSNGAGQ